MLLYCVTRDKSLIFTKITDCDQENGSLSIQCRREHGDDSGFKIDPQTPKTLVLLLAWALRIDTIEATERAYLTAVRKISPFFIPKVI
jgi:hypothetical protein